MALDSTMLSSDALVDCSLFSINPGPAAAVVLHKVCHKLADTKFVQYYSYSRSWTDAEPFLESSL